ncbi:SDR family oxidoreductase [Rubellimicrobium roseum]|uniref:SDR family oxidoreductase n=1 Tax=Rubellimicrobium roseum TaxID=687525 RepID=A0A5C4NHX4_9RHOB|nr:SDR family oxidoreductase [Rubellimicrobium roseum]TNC74203.1 SDR family oxidoreductase [Rubellimicrobium roseum]
MSGRILVLGASGHVGQPLVAELVARGEAVRAASRGGQARGGAEGVRFDWHDPATHEAAFEGVDRVFALLPAGQLDSPGLLRPVVERAAAQGAKVVLMTAMGVDADDSIPYRQAELMLERSGARWTVIRPNWFMDNFHSYWLDGVKRGAITVPAGEGKTSFIDARDIAASAAGALTSDRFEGRAFNLTGPEALSYHEAAAVLSNVAGRTIAYRPVDDESFVGMMTGAGMPEDYARFLTAIFGPVREGWAAALTGDVEELTGRRPRDLRAYAQDHAAALRLAA